MDKVTFGVPEFLMMDYEPISRPNERSKKISVVDDSLLDLSEYIIPQVENKDRPKVTDFLKYDKVSFAEVDDQKIYEKHVWVEEHVLNASGAEKLYMYSIRNEVGRLKEINNFYSVYPNLLKSEPSFVIEGDTSMSWEFQRHINIGKLYAFKNSLYKNSKFEISQRLKSFTTVVKKKAKRTDTDVIEMMCWFDDVLARKAYFSKGQGLVSLITPDYVMIKMGY